MADFMRGRLPSQVRLPPQMTEFFLCKEFGWTLDYVRDLPVNDFVTMCKLLNVYLTIRHQQEEARAARPLL